MTALNQTAPKATAPKTGQDFVKFEPFPESGPTILTIVGYNFIKDYVDEQDDGTTKIYDALEFYYGTITEAGPRFLKTRPAKYSIHEKSNYYKLYKAATGSLPLAGSSPEDIIGKGVQADLSNEDKVSKKGTKYTSTRIKGIAAVFPKLRSEIVPVDKLAPAFKAALSKSDEAKADAKAPSESNPF